MDPVTTCAQPIGVVPDQLRDDTEPAWACYVEEILGHAGLPYRIVAPGLSGATAPDAGGAVPPLLVFAGPPSGSDTGALAAWLTGGGRLVLLGGPGSLAGLAGVDAGPPVAEGRVVVGPTPAWGPPLDVALRAFGGVLLSPTAPDVSVVGRWVGSPDGAAITVRRVGAGTVVVFGADLCQSVVRIQQGWPVHGDGTPPPDGTSPVDDGVLKVDDGIALSYLEDRALPTGESATDEFVHAWPPVAMAPYFHRPHADLWRHLLLRTLWWLAADAGVTLPWLGYWPAGVPAVGHLSHDTDGNADDDATVALDDFAAAGVRATWCFLPPAANGPTLSAAVRDRIAADGHEVGLHFDAHSSGREFTAEELAGQLAWIRDLAGPVVSNKNHYLRWEGWTEFYRWCAANGIEVDQTHGPGTQGNVGFPFGTCHVSFPLDGHGVLALPLHFQDLAWTVQVEVRDAVLGEVLAHHGVLHCLFHGANMRLSRPTRDAVLSTVERARSLGMPWWTSAEINRWERARRGVRLAVGPGKLHIDSTVPVTGAAILLPLAGPSSVPPRVTGAPCRTVVVQRHGIPHLEIAVDLLPGRTVLEFG